MISVIMNTQSLFYIFVKLKIDAFKVRKPKLQKVFVVSCFNSYLIAIPM